MPSESDVLGLVDSLLVPHLRPKQHTAQTPIDPVSYVNASYEKTADNACALKFGFEINNPSMAEKLKLRDGNYTFIENSIQRKLNQILCDSDTSVEFYKVNFVNNSMEVIAIVDYVFLQQDIKSPSVFIQELLKLMNKTITITTPAARGTSFYPTSTQTSDTGKTSLPLMNRTGSALVASKLLFRSSSPVPSETQVLNVINTLLKSRKSQLNKSVQVLNVTYNNITATSYAVIFTLNLINISIPEDPELKNNTYQLLQNVINNVLNTLLNEPGSKDFEAVSSTFTCTDNHIEGSMEYIFNNKDQPTTFLKELNLQSSLITTTLATPGISKTTKETTALIGRVIFEIRLNFIPRGPMPSESDVLELVDSLLAPHLRPKQHTAQTPIDPVSYVNASYEKTAENSCALKFGFEINNPSMAEKLELRDGNYTFIENSIKRKLNQILSDSDTSVEFNKANFVNNSMEVIAFVDYVVLQQDIKSPSVFIHELLKLMNKTITTTTPAKGGTTFISTVLNTTITNYSTSAALVEATSTQTSDIGKTSLPSMNRTGSALVASKLLFRSSSPVPSETQVLNVINSLLKSRESQLNKSVQVLNVTYNNITATSYAVIFTLNLININIPEDPELKNNTYQHLQNVINNMLNKLLNEPGSKDFEAKSSTFTIGRVIFEIRLNFIPRGPMPSESDVLELVDSLLAPHLRPKQHTAQTPIDPVSYVNASYEKTAENSCALKFGFEINNPSMAEKLELRDGNYTFIENSIKRKLNQILSDSDTSVEFNKANFVNNSMEVIAFVDYVVLQQDIKSPSVFIHELLKLMNKTITTTTPAKGGTTFISTVLNTTITNYSTSAALVEATSTQTSDIGKTSLPSMNRTGSALVSSKLLFRSSSPVPSETQVLNVINSLLKSRKSQLNKSVQVLNVTYNNITATSYAVIFTLNLININIPEDPELKNNTYQHLQNVISNMLNKLLNETGSKDFEAVSSTFTCTENHIEGSMEYIFNKDQPTIFLKELNIQSSLITTTLATPGISKTTKDTTTLIGRVIFDIRLNFMTRGPIPSESDVLELVNSLLVPHLRPKQDTAQMPIDPVSYVNASYEKTADNACALKFGFEINNPSMAEKLELRDGNYTFIENSIKRKLNQILSDSDISVEFDKANFVNNSMEVIAFVDYVFLQQDIKSPSVFIQKLLKLMNEISDMSYDLNFEFEISNVTIPDRSELRGSTYKLIQDTINKLLNDILSDSTATPIVFKDANFTINSTTIQAKVQYIFSESDIQKPSTFLQALIVVNSENITTTTPAATRTTFYPTVLNTKIINNSTSAAWVVAIIVPCAIAIMLIPCWILLCVNEKKWVDSILSNPKM
ncbi:putative threonine-rich GPI-anchored glyco -like protein [Labeo rohita]|uniref:Putative threonine-rich GPI-anchored glyco-like protein n=1 Tax=Labeo rohita TaxID=84645 RepID=A0A498N6E8_LABRO|nr:putative threonine-rich GPI-anchored glyco -like protein [Labeo rohita]